MLLVTIVTGANADETVFSAVCTASSDVSIDAGRSEVTSNVTISGGKMYVNNGQSEAKKLLTSKGFCMTNNNTYFEVELSSDLADGDKITIKYTGGVKNSDNKGLKIDSQSGSASGSAIAATSNDETALGSTLNYTVTTEDVLVGKKTFYIYRAAGATQYFNNIEITRASATTAPEITTDLPATADVTVGVAEGFSIVATGATSYQWYNGENAIEGATSATYSYTAAAAGTVNLKCVATNSIGSTSSTVCAVTATAPSSAPTITTDLSAAYNVIKGQTQELSIVAEGASSYQWYVDGEPVEGATSASYTFTAGSTIGATNEVYCAATNAAGTTNSATATMTTVGRADCELTNIKFSNGAYGAINNAIYGDGTIAVPYIAGTSAPTVEETSINISDGATYVLSGNTLTVTAEDETTSKEFTINAVEITPLTVSADVAKTEFTAVPSWVFNLYGFGENKSDTDYKGVKFAKKVDEAGNMRIALGNTRQYWFVGAATSITLTSGTGASRDIKVYRNGVQLSEPTKTAAKGSDITIALDETAPCMIMIESNQTSGDGGFTFYAIEAVPAPTTETITIPEDGVLTYVTENDLDFSTIDGDITAYAVTAVSATSATTAVVAQVPAGTALLIKGTAGSYDIEIAESASAITNLLLASDGTITGGDNIYAYSKTAKKFKKVASTVTIPAGKAYLQANAGDAIDIDFAGEATAVEAIAEAAEAVAPVKVVTAKGIQIGKYNIAGQQVK